MATPDPSHQNHVRGELEWFLRNLTLQLDDQYLLDCGVRLDQYWDTADVRRAVLGAEEFFENEVVKEGIFKERKTLVTCLAADGWLGPIRLLEPHQAEFARSLRFGFGLEGKTLSAHRVQEFFQTIGLPDSSEIRLDGFAKKSATEKMKIIAKYAGKAELLFKAVQCAHGSWKMRLSSMYTKNLLDLSGPNDIDYAEIFNDPLFRDLKLRLNARRPERTINNDADATCICILKKQVARYNSGMGGKVLPHFFESRPLFREVLNDLDRIDCLNYVGMSGKKVSILRDLDYYVFKATFSANSALTSHAEHTESLESLKTVRATVNDLLEASGPLSPEVVDQILVNGRRLSEVIGELRRFWFLEKIWLPYIASEAVSAASIALEYPQVNSEENKALQESIDKAIDGATRALDGNVLRYRWLSELWNGVEGHANRLRKRYAKSPPPPQQDQIYPLSGIVRFGVPNQYRASIEEIVGGLVLEDEANFRRGLTRLSKLCIDARERKVIEPRATVLSVLWILEMDSAIHDIGVDYVREESWLVAIAAASAVRAGRMPNGRKGLRELELRYQRSSSEPSKISLAISIAYLYFHIWKTEGGEVLWRNNNHSHNKRPQQSLHQSLEKAIDFSDIAYKMHVDDIEIRLYSLNLLLYYIVEGGSDSRFHSAQELAHELLQRRGERSYWQYRFDDTLARYFHRRSTLASGIEDKQILLKRARYYIDAAAAESHGNPNVEDYQTLLIDMAVLMP